MSYTKSDVKFGIEFVCSHCACPSSAHVVVFAPESWKGATIEAAGRKAIRRCARCERTRKPCHGAYPVLDPRRDEAAIRALKSAKA